MENIEQIAKQNHQEALRMLEKLRIIPIWEKHGAQVHPVGSLANGLYMDSHDLDLHIYSAPVTVEGSFAAMAELMQTPGMKDVYFNNLLDTEEACLEWHAHYTDPNGSTWKMDLIHIQKGSTFDGYFEKQAERIKRILTPETKRAVLEIKRDLKGGELIGGIWVYTAVFKHGIRNAKDFLAWYQIQDKTQIVLWDDK